MIIDKVDFPIYALIIISSLIIGMMYVYFSLYKKDLVYLYCLLAIFLALIFGKALNVIISLGKVNIINAGISSYGGLIGVILAAVIFERIISFNGMLIKYSIISLPLIYGLSKISCFISGCCYGIPYNGLFNVTYPFGLNIPLFPIQIVETVVFILIFVICNKYKEKEQIIWIAIIISSFCKFVLDFLRYEHIKVLITTNQIISIILIIISFIVLVLNKVKINNSK